MDPSRYYHLNIFLLSKVFIIFSFFFFLALAQLHFPRFSFTSLAYTLEKGIDGQASDLSPLSSTAEQAFLNIPAVRSLSFPQDPIKGLASLESFRVISTARLNTLP